eukprot:12101437-Alexandrium_andersonii.AAC.1
MCLASQKCGEGPRYHLRAPPHTIGAYSPKSMNDNAQRFLRRSFAGLWAQAVFSFGGSSGFT